MTNKFDYYVVDADGKLVTEISGTHEFVYANIQSGQFAILENKPTTLSYWDFVLSNWVALPPKPADNYIFNYVTKQWVDPRTIDVIKSQKWTEVKSKRDAFEFGGFEFEGNIYDSDQVSQGRILGAVLAGLPQIWTLTNNTTVSLSAQQLKSLYAALQMHVVVAHERGRIAREAIQAATTKEQIEAIVF